jgi:hypothetical protein
VADSIDGPLPGALSCAGIVAHIQMRQFGACTTLTRDGQELIDGRLEMRVALADVTRIVGSSLAAAPATPAATRSVW